MLHWQTLFCKTWESTRNLCTCAWLWRRPRRFRICRRGFGQAQCDCRCAFGCSHGQGKQPKAHQYTCSTNQGHTSARLTCKGLRSEVYAETCGDWGPTHNGLTMRWVLSDQLTHVPPNLLMFCIITTVVILMAIKSIMHLTSRRLLGLRIPLTTTLSNNTLHHMGRHVPLRSICQKRKHLLISAVKCSGARFVWFALPSCTWCWLVLHGERVHRARECNELLARLFWQATALPSTL